MKLLDVNVVLPAHRDDHPDHVLARTWLNGLLASGEQFAVPWLVWWSFLRLSTHHRIFSVPTPLEQALEFIRAVRAQPGHVSAGPGPGHDRHLEAVCVSGEATGDLMPDAVLATLAIEHGGVVVSFDRDFARFPNVRWEAPQAVQDDADEEGEAGKA